MKFTIRLTEEQETSLAGIMEETGERTKSKAIATAIAQNAVLKQDNQLLRDENRELKRLIEGMKGERNALANALKPFL